MPWWHRSSALGGWYSLFCTCRSSSPIQPKGFCPQEGCESEYSTRGARDILAHSPDQSPDSSLWATAPGVGRRATFTNGDSSRWAPFERADDPEPLCQLHIYPGETTILLIKGVFRCSLFYYFCSHFTLGTMWIKCGGRCHCVLCSFNGSGFCLIVTTPHVMPRSFWFRWTIYDFCHIFSAILN